MDVPKKSWKFCQKLRKRPNLSCSKLQSHKNRAIKLNSLYRSFYRIKTQLVQGVSQSLRLVEHPRLSKFMLLRNATEHFQLRLEFFSRSAFHWTRMIFDGLLMDSFLDIGAGLDAKPLVSFDIDVLAAKRCSASRMAVRWSSSSSSSSDSRWQNFRLFIQSSFSDKLNIENAGSPVAFMPEIIK